LTRSFSSVAKHLVDPAAKARYVAVSKQDRLPWWFIAVVHERESSQSWTGSLAQGDPWNKVSVHVPAGRGPFHSWEDAAVDALTNCGPFAAHNKDWGYRRPLTMLEQYNGLGYFNGPVTSITALSSPDIHLSRRLTSGLAPININPASMFAMACSIRMPSTSSSAAPVC